jgi:hypothetical protein
LCQQIENIFDINNEPYNQGILVPLISQIIMQLFMQSNIDETILFNNEVRKFNLLIKNVSYENEKIDVDTFFDEIDTSNMSSEQIEVINNQNEDDKEASQALDLDIEKDNDVDDTDDGIEMFQSEDRDD